MEDTIDEYLGLLNDVKPITVRQCIQSLGKILQHKPNLIDKVASGLIAFDLVAVKETMRKSVLLDILNALLLIHSDRRSDEVNGFIFDSLAGSRSEKMLGTGSAPSPIESRVS